MKAFEPCVSVIIPTLNEVSNIVACLASLKAQDYPANKMEIIVVDNGSEDDTVRLAVQNGAKVIDGAGLKIGAVRNLGVEASESECDIIAFLDADCIARPTWIRGTVALLEDPQVGAVGGYFSIPTDANWVQKGWVPPGKDPNRAVMALATGSFFIRKSVILRLGGFDETVTAGEDTELSHRLSRSGLRLYRTNSATVEHRGYPDSIVGFLKRQIWQSSNYMQTRRAGVDLTFIGVAVFFASIILAPLLFIFPSIHEVAVAVGLAPLVVWSGFVIKRLKDVPFSAAVTALPAVAAVNLLYLLGRSAGLALSVAGYAANKHDKKWDY